MDVALHTEREREKIRLVSGGSALASSGVDNRHQSYTQTDSHKQIHKQIKAGDRN